MNSFHMFFYIDCYFQYFSQKSQPRALLINERLQVNFFFKHNMDVELNQSDCFKMMSFIKTSNHIALKAQHPLCLHKNLPLTK